MLSRLLGNRFPVAPRERFSDTVRPVSQALAERSVLLLVAVAALASRPELVTISIAGALSSHSVPLGKRLFDHILHVFAAAGATGAGPFHAGGGAKKKVAGESQKCETLRPASPAPESSAPPRSSHVTASCGFTKCLQAIDRHATAKPSVIDMCWSSRHRMP